MLKRYFMDTDLDGNYLEGEGVVEKSGILQPYSDTFVESSLHNNLSTKVVQDHSFGSPSPQGDL